MDRMKLRCNSQKAALARKLDGLEVRLHALEAERDGVTGDRLKRLAMEKQATQFAEKEKLTASVTREFVITVEGTENG